MNKLVHLLAERGILLRQTLSKMLLVDNLLEGLI